LLHPFCLRRANALLRPVLCTKCLRTSGGGRRQATPLRMRTTLPGTNIEKLRGERSRTIKCHLRNTMSSKSNKENLNELQYISWKEFKKMAPPVIKLEINRIGKLTNSVSSGSDIYNSFVKARYELNQFVECLEKTDSPPLPNSCTEHLSKAILNLALEDADESISKTTHYILDRLNYVYNRIGMIC